MRPLDTAAAAVGARTVITRGVQPPGFWRVTGEVVAESFAILRAGSWRLAALFLAGQAIVGLIVAPVLHWLFVEALHAAGAQGMDTKVLPRLITVPGSAAWIIALVAVAFVVLALQCTVFVLAVQQVRTTGRVDLRVLGRDAARLATRLVRPSSWPLLGYLFLLVPLSGFGSLSVLTKAIAVPSFISGELLRSTPGTIGWTVFLVVLAFVSVRYALTVPLFTLSGLGGWGALRASRRLTRRGAGVRVAVVVTAIVAAMLAAGAAITVLVLPVAVADAVAPGAAPVVAAVCLALAEVAGILVIGAGTVLLCAALVVLTARAQGEERRVVPVAERRRRGILVPVATLSVFAVWASFANLPAMEQLSRAPQTLVLAHRGDMQGAVENTVAALEGAHAAGVDYVETDVLQTADGDFVIMHDTSLSRLAGVDAQVADLPLGELRALEIRNKAGMTDRMPGLDEFVLRAKEIGQPLLIEIKHHGHETDDYVESLVARLDELGAMEGNIFHTLDAPTVEELKRLRPTATVGYIQAFGGIEVPVTSADFLVVEEWSYTQELRAAAERAGLPLVIWTVDGEPVLRGLLRDDVAGMITDHPPTALALRERMGEDPGLAAVLWDAIARYVTVL